MNVSWKYIRYQRSALRAIGRTAVAALRKPATGALPELPGPWIESRVSALPKGLVDAYIQVVGGEPSDHPYTVPPHLFPQWSFGPAAATMEGLPYPALKIVNGGYSLEILAPIPRGSALHLRARLESVEETERNAFIRQRVQTSLPDGTLALDAIITAVVPLGKKGTGGGAKREKTLIPADTESIASLEATRQQALNFAKTTGDFNPIHWVPAYAKLSGFKNTILHGFATAAIAMEAFFRAHPDQAADLTTFECRFTRPLTLPASIDVFCSGEASTRTLLVGSAPGTEPFMSATLQLSTPT